MFVVGDNGVCRFGRLRLWAERGLIRVEDSRDGRYEVVTVKTALHRMKAHADMLRNSREYMKRTGFMDATEYERIQRMLEQMVDVCRKAQEQGMPSDASARRDLVRRRPKTVAIPSGNAIM